MRHLAYLLTGMAALIGAFLASTGAVLLYWFVVEYINYLWMPGLIIGLLITSYFLGEALWREKGPPSYTDDPGP